MSAREPKRNDIYTQMSIYSLVLDQGKSILLVKQGCSITFVLLVLIIQANTPVYYTQYAYERQALGYQRDMCVHVCHLIICKPIGW